MQDPRQAAEMVRVLQEHCVQARTAFEQNPNDYQALAKWGEVLLELSMLKQGDEAMQLIMQCIDKLERSLDIFADNHNALVVLASALNARAFLQQDANVAAELFEGAKANFQKALALDPGNQRYRQLLEAMESAPQLHAQVMAQLQTHGGGGGGGGAKAPADDDWFYDALGWGILLVGGVVVITALNAKAAAMG